MKNITLVVLAAGMGSRFGGLKQIAPLGPNGEFIIDYSIYDAIKAGFNKVVFLIKKENFEVFKETIGKRVDKHIRVSYCFQENDNLPDGYVLPETRVKPLGTAHAILCCEKEVDGPFAIINSDDFYGRDAFLKAYQYLTSKKDTTITHYGMVSYIISNTMTLNGSVKRGICEVDNDKLTGIIESKVEHTPTGILASPLSGAKPFIVDSNTTVSMNLLLFDTSIFKYIKDGFKTFLDANKDLSSCEYLIPDVLFDNIKKHNIIVDIIKTDATWYGVTYKEDSAFVKDNLKRLVQEREYPNKLWN